MAEEYIKRKDAITAFGNYLGATSVRAYVAAEKILSTVPSEDVKPALRGHWVRVDWRSTVVTYHCSECKFYAHTEATNFCPNCGADMRDDETAIS